MNWLLFSLLQVGLSTCYQLLARVLAVKSENPRAFSVVFNTIAASLSFLLITIEPLEVKQFSLRFVGLMLVSTILYGLFERTQFYARKGIEASRMTVLGRIVPVVSVIASIVILGEQISPLKFLAIALILVGSLLVIEVKKQAKASKALVYALIAFISLGLAWVNDKQASVGYSLSLYALLIWWIPIVYNLFIPPLPLSELRRELRVAGWKVGLLAFINVFDYYVLIKALSLGEASKVIPVTSASTITVVAFGVLFLRERGNLVKKAVAAALVVSGVVLMSVL